MSLDFYDLLGVDRDASPEEIRRAFRRQVREYHPDRNDDPRAPAQFTALKKAYNTLADEKERAAYDRLGHDEYVKKRISGLPSVDNWEVPEEAVGTDGDAPADGDSEDDWVPDFDGNLGQGGDDGWNPDFEGVEFEDEAAGFRGDGSTTAGDRSVGGTDLGTNGTAPGAGADDAPADGDADRDGRPDDANGAGAGGTAAGDAGVGTGGGTRTAPDADAGPGTGPAGTATDAETGTGAGTGPTPGSDPGGTGAGGGTGGPGGPPDDRPRTRGRTGPATGAGRVAGVTDRAGYDVDDGDDATDPLVDEAVRVDAAATGGGRSVPSPRAAVAGLRARLASINAGWGIVALADLVYVAGVALFALANAEGLLALATDLTAGSGLAGASRALATRHGVETLSAYVVGPFLGGLPATPLAYGAAVLPVGALLLPAVYGYVVRETRRIPSPWEPSYAFVVPTLAPAVAVAVGALAPSAVPGLYLELVGLVALPAVAMVALPTAGLVIPRVRRRIRRWRR